MIKGELKVACFKWPAVSFIHYEIGKLVVQGLKHKGCAKKKKKKKKKKHEMSHVMRLRYLRKLIIQKRMNSHPVG